jgi:hypothetical protein
MKVKNCFVCHIIKPLEDFYVHQKMGDGYLNKCKDCTKEQSKERFNKLSNNQDWLKSEKERNRLKYHRLNYRGKNKPTTEQKALTQKRYELKYPEKQKAAQKLNSIKMTNTPGTHRHHWSYNEQHYLDIIPLTIEQHNLAHRHMVYDQERMMYRRIDTMELLDNKEQHEQYIKNLPF